MYCQQLVSSETSKFVDIKYTILNTCLFVNLTVHSCRSLKILVLFLIRLVGWTNHYLLDCKFEWHDFKISHFDEHKLLAVTCVRRRRAEELNMKVPRLHVGAFPLVLLSLMASTSSCVEGKCSSFFFTSIVSPLSQTSWGTALRRYREV